MKSRKDRRRAEAFERACRARMKADAKERAAQWAGIAAYTHADGRVTPITDPLAVRALERAYFLMFSSGGNPACIHLSNDEARAFPYQEVPHEDCQTFLAVGLDVDLLPCFAVEGVTVVKFGPDGSASDLRESSVALASRIAREAAMYTLAESAAVSARGPRAPS